MASIYDTSEKYCEMLADLADLIADCIWIYDLQNGQIKFVSPSFASLSGYTAEEAQNLGLADFLSPESAVAASMVDKARCLLSGDESAANCSVNVYDFRCRDGTVKSVEFTSRLVVNRETGLFDMVSTLRDVTSWVEREKAFLRELEEKDEAIRKLISSEKELADLTLELLNRNENLREKVMTDDMTGLSNRYFFNRRASEEVERSERYKTPLSLIIFDLDRFKNINDSFGHDIGDCVLIGTADIVRQSIRKPDVLARWGGEEFALLVPQTDLLGSAALAEKLRDAIARVQHPKAGTVSASFGVAEWIAGEPFESWFRRADQALYQAKSKGRNCVVCSSSEAGTPISLVRLDWKDVWDSGDPVIDREHRRLVTLANGLLDLTSHKDSPENARQMFNQLIEGIISHFTDEEKIIEAAGYPDTPRHAERHQNLIKKLLRLNNNLLRAELTPAAFYTFLVDEVIIGHMLIEDVLFFPYIRASMAETH